MRGANAIAAWRVRLSPLDGFVVVAALLSLWLRALVPPQILPNSPHDDLLGVQLARSILQGHWLGPWSNRVLLKPPGYSLFLAAIHPLSIPPTVAIHLLYLLLGLYSIYLLGQSRHLVPAHPLVSRGLFILFAFNPGVLGGDFSRIYRMSLNSVAALFYAVCFFHLLLILKSLRAGRSVPYRAFAVIALLLGLAYAVMVLTRPEAYWVLLPSIAVLSVVVLGDLRRKHPSPNRWLMPRLLVAGVTLTGVAFALPWALVRHANRAVYGVAAIENLQSGNFAKAVNLWSSVREGRDDRSFITISRGQREAVYAISPTGAQLRPLLETPPGSGWKAHNCEATRVCDEAGAWFVYELRDAAVAVAGLTDEAAFQNYFGTLATDISAACSTRRLTCGPPGVAPGVRSLREHSPKQVFDTSMKVLGSLVAFEQAQTVARPDYGQDAKQLAFWKRTVAFDKVVTTGEYDLWQAMGNTVRVLQRLYASLSPFLCALTLVALLRRSPDSLADGSYWFLLYLSGCMGLYCAGMAVFEASLGFPVSFAYYALPAQPVFLLALLIGLGSTASMLVKRRSNQVESAGVDDLTTTL